jgi:sodium/hydrogen antiporter
VVGVLALTVVRMVPVALALAGAGLDRSTIAFVGWFGPRGLASIVFGLIAFDTLDRAESKVLLSAVILSVLLHGVTASPLAARYGKSSRRFPSEHREHADTPAIRTRALRTGLGSRT